VVGVLSGMWLLHEPLTWRELAAGVLILGAIALVLRPSRRAAAPKPSEPPIV
jgi:drug/metabolite transporter (DMT)-like permease